MWSCTCDSPPLIDLTESFLGERAQISSDLLRSALATHGWCHIVIDSSRVPTFQHFVKSNFVKLFDKNDKQYDVMHERLRDQGATYRDSTAESGSATAKQAEPKQSWEIHRCAESIHKTTILHECMNALHSVAVTVTRSLALPENTLLKETPCPGCRPSSGRPCQEEWKCNVDLLRVFLYEARINPTLGSSPHTDWGSWTVVWQDNMGGLQTKCPVHNSYVDVLPQNDPVMVYFVVHVGDVTSLSLGHASKEGSIVSFPSPNHQVLCPKTNERISLVYFAYPPPFVSLAQIESTLQDHPVLNVQGAMVDYTTYFLLKNQIPGGKTEDPQQVYKRIRNMPLGKCFQTKWEQVQRKSPQRQVLFSIEG